MTPFNLSEAKRLFAEGEYQKATNQNMSYGVLEGGYVPSNGEIVDCIVGSYTNKDGIKVLSIQSIIPVKAIIDTANVSLSLEEEPASAEASEEGDVA